MTDEKVEAETKVTERQVWKELKEVTKGDKCMVSMYEEHCRYSDGSDPGGYSITHYSVTDDSSEKAYITLQAMLAGSPVTTPDDSQPQINKRASRAVDVA